MTQQQKTALADDPLKRIANDAAEHLWKPMLAQIALDQLHTVDGLADALLGGIERARHENAGNPIRLAALDRCEVEVRGATEDPQDAAGTSE